MVNGQALDEREYIFSPPTYTYPAGGLPSVIPPDHYFVLGDNRNASEGLPPLRAHSQTAARG